MVIEAPTIAVISAMVGALITSFGYTMGFTNRLFRLESKLELISSNLESLSETAGLELHKTVMEISTRQIDVLRRLDSLEKKGS